MSSASENKHIPEVFGARTDVGCVRGHNEDSFLAQSPLFVVADGMGGHEAGEVASSIAINTIKQNIPTDATQLAEGVKKANMAVLRGAQNGTGKPGMGTTMTAAIIYDDELTIAQVGDSRAYLLHDDRLQRITRDHSLVADLIDQGRITEEEARYHPQRSVITRALGSDPAMEPDVFKLHVEEGDRLLLCSDGLSNMVDDPTIQALMVANVDPQRCCEVLVDEALANGGLDNITAVVIDPFAEKVEEKGRTSVSAPKKKRKGRFAPLIWAIAFVLLLAAAGGGFYAYTQHSYYLIAEDGYVCVYKGLPGEVAGLKFSWLEEQSEIPVDKLAPSTASRLQNGISVDSLDEANALLDSYRQSTGISEQKASDKASATASTDASTSKEAKNTSRDSSTSNSTSKKSTKKTK